MTMMTMEINKHRTHKPRPPAIPVIQVVRTAVKLPDLLEAMADSEIPRVRLAEDRS